LVEGEGGHGGRFVHETKILHDVGSRGFLWTPRAPSIVQVY
jgi:hypothetical protein